MSVSLLFDPNSFTIDGCAQCNALLTDFKDAVIAQGLLQRDADFVSLSEWLGQDERNRFEIFLKTMPETVVYAEGGIGPGDIQIFNCLAFFNAVYEAGFPNCSEVERVFCARASGVFNVEDSVPFVATSDLFATITEVPNPVLTVRQPVEPICEIEPFEQQTVTLESPQTEIVFLFNGAIVTLSGSCGDFIVTASESDSQAFDCAGMPVEFNLPSEYACRDVTYTFTAASTTCPDKQTTANVNLRQIGSPCFDCPPDRCAVESEDFDATLAALKESDTQIVLDSATNGCGSSDFNKSVTCVDRVTCNRCCRGELALERTWTLANLDCDDRNTSCVQRLRLVNPQVNARWERYFPCSNGPCDCAQ